MNCTEVRTQLLDRHRGTLAPDARGRVEAHLAGCEACRSEDAAERALSDALRKRLVKRRAPESLRRAVAEGVFGDRPGAPPRTRRSRPLLALTAGAVVALAAAAAALLFVRPPGGDLMVAEAVNDHLRVLYSSHPLEVESGGVHQVKPWFEGRVDFAPSISFGGDEDFPLEGGSVAYFVDRKAAAYVFKRRLHVITLFVYRAEGLPWPAPLGGTVGLGRVRATERTARGFHVLFWRDGDLGYSLVSDLDPRELEALGAKIAGEPALR